MKYLTVALIFGAKMEICYQERFVSSYLISSLGDGLVDDCVLQRAIALKALQHQI
jgi:hypothetical protein